MHSLNYGGTEVRQQLHRIPWFLPVATLLLYLLRTKYGYGESDQDDFLPLLLHLLDPSVLAADWHVSGQAASFGPRTLFVWLAYLPAKLIGPYTTCAILHVTSWSFSAGAVYALSYRISADQIAATGTVVAVMVLTPVITLGGNDLVYSMLVPSMPAWALALWGLVVSDRGRVVWAGVLLGLATWLQALVGLHAAGLSGLLLLWCRKEPRAVLFFCATYVLVALPALLPQVVQHWSSSEIEPSVYHILFEYRAPHHYLITRFEMFRSLAFSGLLALALACLPLLEKTQRTFPVRILAIVAASCLAGFAGTELFMSEFIGKLQLFKMTVIAKVVIVAIVCHAVNHYLPDAVRRLLAPFYRWEGRTLAGTVLVAVSLLIISPDALGLRPRPVTANSAAHHQIEAWAQASTAKESVIAVPPSWSGVRSRAQRAIVVNIKSVPFEESRMLEWYERMQAFAPVGSGGQGPLRVRLPEMDAAFLALEWKTLLSLHVQYGFDYVIRRSSAPDTSGVQRVFTAGELAVYHILPR